jgi:hypothetical protein
VKTQKPVGKHRLAKFSVDAKGMKVGSRTLKGWLDLGRIPGLISTASEEAIPDLIA